MSNIAAAQDCRPAPVQGEKIVDRVVRAVKLRLCVWRTQRALARLDDRALKDVGLSRSEIARAAERSCRPR